MDISKITDIKELESIAYNAFKRREEYTNLANQEEKNLEYLGIRINGLKADKEQKDKLIEDKK